MKWIILVFTAVFICNGHTAELDNIPVFRLSPKTVVVFKSGFGYVVKEGRVETSGGWAVTEQVPEASFGTYWIGTADRVVLEEAVALRDIAFRKQPAVTVEELIRANPGRDVVLYSGDKSYRGKIISQEEMLFPRDGGAGVNPGYFLLQTQEGVMALRKSDIDRVMFTSAFTTELQVRMETNRIRMRFSEKKQNVKVQVSYLQRGLSWAPSYQAQVLDDKKLRLTMNAIVLNDVEDLENVDFSLTVGFPNFQYAGVVTPLALQQTVYGFMGALNSPSGGGQYAQNMMNVQRVVSYDREDRFSPSDYSDYGAVPDTAGQSSGELFFYLKTNVSLKKGQRSYYLLFSKEIPYQNIYEWAIPDNSGISVYGYQESGARESDKDLQVWHTMKLENGTGYPWTTAPVFVVRKNDPMAQDMLNYTPIGAKINVRITVAPDIRTEKKETELERKRNVRLNGVTYDLVTVSGEMTVKNYKKEEISMEVKKKLTGEIVQADNGGVIQKTAESIKGVNPSGVVNWSFSLKPGAQIILKYEYRVYVRS